MLTLMILLHLMQGHAAPWWQLSGAMFPLLGEWCLALSCGTANSCYELVPHAVQASLWVSLLCWLSGRSTQGRLAKED